MNLQEQYKRLFKGRVGTTDKKLVTEAIKFRTESGLDEKDFQDTVLMIHKGATGGDEMVDEIGDELGDFYDAIHSSGNKELIEAYAELREAQYEDPDFQAEAAQALLDIIG